MFSKNTFHFLLDAFGMFLHKDEAFDSLTDECPSGVTFLTSLELASCRGFGVPSAQNRGTYHMLGLREDTCDYIGSKMSILLGRVTIRVLAATRFPTLQILTASSNLSPTPELGCYNAKKSAVDWDEFRESLWWQGSRQFTSQSWIDNAIDH